MFRRRPSMSYMSCVVAAAAVAGAVGYAMMSSRYSMKSVKRKAAKTIGRISDKMIDNIHSMM